MNKWILTALVSVMGCGPVCPTVDSVHTDGGVVGDSTGRCISGTEEAAFECDQMPTRPALWFSSSDVSPPGCVLTSIQNGMYYHCCTACP
jgi:hypothetical protein